MSHFLGRLTYLSRRRESFADAHGELRDEDRMWEEGYRQRWQHDKIVRSTHGVNLHDVSSETMPIGCNGQTLVSQEHEALRQTSLSPKAKVRQKAGRIRAAGMTKEVTFEARRSTAR